MASTIGVQFLSLLIKLCRTRANGKLCNVLNLRPQGTCFGLPEKVDQEAKGSLSSAEAIRKVETRPNANLNREINPRLRDKEHGQEESIGYEHDNDGRYIAISGTPP